MYYVSKVMPMKWLIFKSLLLIRLWPFSVGVGESLVYRSNINHGKMLSSFNAFTNLTYMVVAATVIIVMIYLLIFMFQHARVARKLYHL